MTELVGAAAVHDAARHLLDQWQSLSSDVGAAV
jgi:hypothetical protein